MNLVQVIWWLCKDCGTVFRTEAGWFERQVAPGGVATCDEHPRGER